MKNGIPHITRKDINMPCVGLGTMLYPEPEKAVDLIKYALDYGYTHIDTARKYGSENWVGEAIKLSDISRDNLWVTTKVTEDNAKPYDFRKSLETSLSALNLDYVDLLLIHWPSRSVPIKDTVRALNDAKEEGLALNIGISNFTVPLIEEAVRYSRSELFCNQIEYHAYINQDKVSHIQEIKDSVTLFNDMKAKRRNIQVLSLGTSSDYKECIKAGSNLIRVGEILFGPRL